MLAAATGVLAVVAVAVFVAVGGNRAAAGKLPLAGGDLAAARFAAETIAKPAAERVEAAPSARAFARSFVTVTNAYAAAHGDPVRIGHAGWIQRMPDHAGELDAVPRVADDRDARGTRAAVRELAGRASFTALTAKFTVADI